MHSYIDVSMVLIFSCVIALLVLILVSFILSVRRARAVEKRLDTLEARLSEISELSEKAAQAQSGYETRIKVLERTSQYFTDHAQHSEDVQKAYDVSVNSLKAQVKALDKNIKELREDLEKTKESCEKVQVKPSAADEQAGRKDNVIHQHAPLTSEQSAREMLRQGLDEQEVVLRTGLPAGEVDMISKMLQPDLNDTALPDNSLKNARAARTSESRPHMVASLKARNAYGMSLRRR